MSWHEGPLTVTFLIHVVLGMLILASHLHLLVVLISGRTGKEGFYMQPFYLAYVFLNTVL